MTIIVTISLLTEMKREGDERKVKRYILNRKEKYQNVLVKQFVQGNLTFTNEPDSISIQ